MTVSQATDVDAVVLRCRDRGLRRRRYGDGDVAVDDCSACLMQLLPESPCSAFRSSTCTAVRSSSLDWPLLLPKRFQERTPRCLISCAAQQVRSPSTLLKRLAVPGRQMPHLPTPSLAGLRWSARLCWTRCSC